jgi:hypothetical protein
MDFNGQTSEWKRASSGCPVGFSQSPKWTLTGNLRVEPSTLRLPSVSTERRLES